MVEELTEKQKRFKERMEKLAKKTSEFMEDYEKLQKINRTKK